MEAKYKKDTYHAKGLYLFWSWKETKSLIKCLFDVDYEESDRENVTRYTQFHKLLIIIMRLSGFNTKEFLYESENQAYLHVALVHCYHH